MTFTKISAAVALLVAAAAAQAAPTAIAYSAGASAIQGNLRSALDNLCKANGGTYQLSALRASGASNDNFVSYVCAEGAVTAANYASATYADFSAGIPFQEIRLNVDQGSFSAIQQVNSVALAYFNPATGANFTPDPASIVKLGGALDVHPTAFPETTIGSLAIPETVAPLGVAQAFGVAVSKPLYAAMYASQLSAGAATIAKPLPSSCGSDAEAAAGKIECIPTISKGQMASIMSDNNFNKAYTTGANFLASTLAVGTELGYARRVNTSGTQAAAQNYFLGLPCSSTALGVVAEGASGTSASSGTKWDKIRVYGLGSTGNVRTVLNDNTRYSIGIMSGENNQTGQNFRWLRVQGAAMGENAIPASASVGNRDGITSGGYDFFYEAVYASGGTEGDAFWADVQGAINSLTPPLGVGLVDSATLSTGFSKNGATCAANSSN